MMTTNGRLDILNSSSTIEENEDITSYNLIHNRYNKSLLSAAFFSKENISIIHNGIRATVFSMSNKKYVIGHQNINILKGIMEQIFLQFCNHIPNREREEIEKINKIVIHYCSDIVFKELQTYLKYREDVSTLTVPNERPQNTYMKGTRSLELQHFF